MQTDVVIFGGGVAGLWLLDDLIRRGMRVVLLERGDLGSGQTVASQGIIHGGLKYTLQGLLTRSAEAIAEMPLLWRDCLAGRRAPNLRQTRIRAESCFLWRTESVSSRLGMIGARFGLRVSPETLTADERPSVLAGCPGTVARLDEPIISPAGLIADLAGRHRSRILQINAEQGLEIDLDGAGQVRGLRLRLPTETESNRGTSRLDIEPRCVVLTAGAGNAGLRERMGLSPTAMQRRPLHMVLVRGRLPELNGHCVDGAKTRVTITSDQDAAGRRVWQVGGQLAEEGVAKEAAELIEHARRELNACVPGLDLSAVQWSTYRVDRAEAVMSGGRRPETIQVLREGNVITAWPTKLVLAPRLADEIAGSLAPSPSATAADGELPADWPRPAVALPPWETRGEWLQFDAGGRLAAAAKKVA